MWQKFCSFSILGMLAVSLSTAWGASPGAATEAGLLASCQNLVGQAIALAAAQGGEIGARLTQLSPPRCMMNEPEGCGAAYSSERIYVDGGSPKCNSPALNPSLVYHEVGHWIQEQLVKQGSRVRDRSLNEGLADLFAAALLNDPKVGRGLFKNRQMTWQRDLNQFFAYPDQARGIYSESLTFSSVAWPVLSRQARPTEKVLKWMSSEALNVASALKLPLIEQKYKILSEKYSRQNKSSTDAFSWAPGGQIPDGQGELRISVSAQANRVQLELQHPLSDDLLILWEDAQGHQTELVKGIEEVPLSDWIDLPEGSSGPGTLIVRDLVAGHGGFVKWVKLGHASTSPALLASGF